ncbi:hypothetical protein NM688_g2507 [Phlebia brevispora]|uniref:Uncharacterized protein n=1 Tax=Phlebia brevispora TaxID=194682 RepID=A0ACC1T8I8_9APHY|nr:hypothetical protein NM688_g2507 [Phlebia brevispora]
MFGVVDHIPTIATQLHFAADLVERLEALTLDEPRPPSPPRPLPNWDLDDFDEWDPRDPDYPRMWAFVQEMFTPTNSRALDYLFDHRFLGDDLLAPGTA